MSEVKTGESVTEKLRPEEELMPQGEISMRFCSVYCTCVSAAGLENMYVQIFRQACKSRGTAELLAT